MGYQPFVRMLGRLAYKAELKSARGIGQQRQAHQTPFAQSPILQYTTIRRRKHGSLTNRTRAAGSARIRTRHVGSLDIIACSGLAGSTGPSKGLILVLNGVSSRRRFRVASRGIGMVLG